jgi:hypothetical protein
MGKNNRARRAAKAKNRQQRQRQPTPPRDWFGSYAEPGEDGDRFEPGFTRAELVEMAWGGLVLALQRNQPTTPYIDRLVDHPAALVDRTAETMVLDQLAHVWAGGWQPAEIARHAKRTAPNAATRRLVEMAIAADHADRPDHTLDHRWSAQVAALQLPAVASRHGWIGAALAELSDRRAQIDAVGAAMVGVLSVPRLDILIPPPGADPDAVWPPGNSFVADDDEPDPVIEKVRNLLAKAESTEFEAEAIAFTAKAHELMTRHAIDRAMVAARTHTSTDRPVAARVFVDSPYADAKALLLQSIAVETRCRCVASLGLGMSTIIGFSDDVAGVQLMFTSLLVQAQAALNVAAKSAPPGARPRSQSYRASFFVAYANRIRERLAESNRAATDAATAEGGSAFLPVLADRRRDVDDLVDERFPEMVNSTVRSGWDPAGRVGGRMAADQAQLRFADLADADPPQPAQPTGALPTA